MKNYIKAECLPFYYNELGERKEKPLSQIIAYTADGFLLPCCWCDNDAARSDMEKFNMHDDHLKLSNNDTVDDILLSAEWENFTKVIAHDFENSPKCCQKRCKAYDK